MKPLLLAKDPALGWAFDYDQIQRVQEFAHRVESVGMQQVNAVMMAMIDAGFAWASKPEGCDHD
jgi:hypothetical protein